MSVLTNRADNEVALGRALSRHIGHTTAAYDLDRILSILTFFQDRPSAYKEEIMAFLGPRTASEKGQDDLSTDYIDGIVSFARALGIIQLTSSRDLRLHRYAPTEQGRSLLAARRVGSYAFVSFYTARVAFLADADSLTALLSYTYDRPSAKLFEFYVSFFLDIRQRRLQWLRDAFQEPLLFARIASDLSWLNTSARGNGEPRIEPFTLSTARHHSTPRKGWLASLGMLDRDADRLTAFGERALASLRHGQPYFWLGPPREVQRALRIAPDRRQPGPFEDEFAFTDRQPEASATQNIALTSAVAELMIEGFDYAKLIHAPQASLQLPMEFIIYRSFKDRVRYDPLAVLEEVFHEQRDKIDRLSALKGQMGFYRVR